MTVQYGQVKVVLPEFPFYALLEKIKRFLLLVA